MKLYTRKGDGGQTAFFDGSTASKDDPRVAAYGDLDELNSHLGQVLAEIGRAAHPPEALRTLEERLSRVQSDLFTLGAELATPGGADASRRMTPVSADDAVRLEGWIDDAAGATPPLTTFVLPAGHPIAAALHVARTVARRAERSAVHVAGLAEINPQIIVYLNRLSDLLFAWARWVNHTADIEERPWPNSRPG